MNVHVHMYIHGSNDLVWSLSRLSLSRAFSQLFMYIYICICMYVFICINKCDICIYMYKDHLNDSYFI